MRVGDGFGTGVRAGIGTLRLAGRDGAGNGAGGGAGARRRGRLRRHPAAWRALLAGLVLALGAGLLSPAAVLAQEIVLLSNISEISNSTIVVGGGANKFSSAQRFTVGNNSAGYTLNSVQLYIVSHYTSDDTVLISIYSNGANNRPGTSLYVLTNPSNIGNAQINTFTAPPNASLERGEKYHVVIQATSGEYRISGTDSNSQESDDAMGGWSIPTGRYVRISDTSRWEFAFRPLRIAIRGSARTTGTDTDTTAPTVTSIVRQMPTTSPTNADDLTWRVTFSEAVKDVNEADFDISGTTATPTVTAMSGSTTVYDVTASGGNLAGLTDTVTLTIKSGNDIKDNADNDLSGTHPSGTNDNTFEVDNTAPTVTSIERLVPTTSPTNANRLVWRVTFSEDVIGVTSNGEDFQVDGTTANKQVAGTNLSRPVLQLAGGDLDNLTGTVTMSFASTQDITDLAGNALINTTPTGTNDNTFEVDNTAPTVTISGVPATSSAAFTATFNFSEDVSGFVLAHIAVGNGAASAFTNTTAGTTWTALITPAGNGTVSVDVAAGVATDAAGNGNTAATQATSTYTAPTPPPPAHCDTSDPLEVWCATLMVGSTATGASTIYGYAHIFGSSDVGSISPNSFTYRGRSIFVTGLNYGPTGLGFHISGSGILGSANYSLEIGTGAGKKTFAINNPGSNLAFTFSSPGLSWSVDDTVPVRLVRVVTAPDAPTNLTATEGDAEVNLMWTAGSDGGSEITAHEYRKKVGSGAYEATWTPILNSAAGGSNASSYTVTTGLTNGTTYTFQVRAVNAEGNSTEATSGEVTPTGPGPTHCNPSDPNEVWCATLTVGERGNHYHRGYARGGRPHGPYGSLSHTSFDHRGTTYTIDEIREGGLFSAEHQVQSRRAEHLQQRRLQAGRRQPGIQLQSTQ